ncbi:TonB-dependent receptor [Thalassotalea insulae]|uniref:TonB-dependent receptor n=1 Tax=Thalassotalea insulae TaxID=2056778 RepID=A0ABQ6GXZ0_9GAMM|nr:TonB-dependent receptor [Thalassotalea insulae]GLX80194.1 TonB-dependent receptor [Thalassotalea insulae]
MFQRKAITCAVLSALGLSTSLSVYADTKELEVIEVTATKRTQNIQSTPVAVQAMSDEDLKDNNIGNFDDFVRYMPNVTVGGRGPGQADVFIRGMAIQPITVMLSGAQGTSPNVALYIDEQPVTAPGRNLDVYATDLERIEVLPGPQGTLFGASSQAGTVRYITKKPDLSGFEAGFTSGLSSTKSGEMSNNVEAYINLPLTNDIAFRAAMYSVHKGGYIDNVYGEFTLDPSINHNVADSVKGLPSDTVYHTANNTDLVEKDFNDSFYTGGRFGLKYEINESWELLVQHTQQELGADGVFDYDPELGELEVQRYFPDKLRDEFGQTSWTVKGFIDELEIVYTGAFLDREVEQSIDYTGYNNSGGYIPWYTCSYASEQVSYRECLDPTKGFKGQQEQQRSTHEFRVATDANEKLRFIGGVFYDDFDIKTQDDYVYVATPELGFAPNAPISTANSINPNARPSGVAFFNDITRTEEQIALFGELSYDLTDSLTLTGGLRWYEIESDFTGSSNFAQTGVDGDSGRDYDASGGHSKEPLKTDDVITKINLSYQANDDVLLYATYSEGFRPGGFNRGGGIPSANPEFPDVEVTYDTDDVTNYEFGWKAMLMDNSLRFNGNVYFIEWDSMQVSRFDPVNVSILTFIENAADSEIKGFEGDITWQATDNLTLYGAFSYNETELTALKAEVIEMAPIGSTLPLTPEFQGNLRARYDWEVGEYYANWQLAAQYAGSSYSSIVASERQKQDSYSLLNASIGIEKDSWSAKFYIDNLTDKRAELFINNQDDIPRVTTNRPRTIGLSFSYSYY